MARFYFDTQNVDPPLWDDDGVECATEDEIEAHAYRMLKAYADRHDGGKAPVSVTVLNAHQAIIMVATLQQGHVEAKWHSQAEA